MQLSASHLRKRFEDTRVLSDVSFEIARGEFVSVIGPSGAGKTTLMRILNGSIPADAGNFSIGDVDFTKAGTRERRALQKQIAMIYQDFCLVEQSTCLMNVLHAALPDMRFFPALFGLFGRQRIAQAEQLLERVGLADKKDVQVRFLSGGQKQRVSIARALMRKPAILLADEPVASLDPVTGQQILSLLRDLQKNDGLTVLMNSHNLALSMEYSDRLIGISDGCVVFSGSPDQATEHILKQIYGDTAKTSAAEASQPFRSAAAASEEDA